MNNGKILSVVLELVMVAVGIYLVIDTELKAPYAGAVPGMFGAHLGKVNGIVLINLGIIFLFGALIFPRTSFLGAFLLLLTCIMAVLTMAGMSLLFWLILSALVTVGYFVTVRLVTNASKN